MEDDPAPHLDRQPPRDEAEAAEQDRLIAEAGDQAPTELPTAAPDPDLGGGEGEGEE